MAVYDNTLIKQTRSRQSSFLRLSCSSLIIIRYWTMRTSLRCVADSEWWGFDNNLIASPHGRIRSENLIHEIILYTVKIIIYSLVHVSFIVHISHTSRSFVTIVLYMVGVRYFQVFQEIIQLSIRVLRKRGFKVQGSAVVRILSCIQRFLSLSPGRSKKVMKMYKNSCL